MALLRLRVLATAGNGNTLVARPAAARGPSPR
jgi:hypothetical protein